MGNRILGKTNLSELANFCDYDSISGWSAIGGQTRNPHYLASTPANIFVRSMEDLIAFNDETPREQASQKRMTPGFVTSTHEMPEIKAAQEKF